MGAAQSNTWLDGNTEAVSTGKTVIPQESLIYGEIQETGANVYYVEMPIVVNPLPAPVGFPLDIYHVSDSDIASSKEIGNISHVGMVSKSKGLEILDEVGMPWYNALPGGVSEGTDYPGQIVWHTAVQQ